MYGICFFIYDFLYFRKYAGIMFITNNRFEACKRKLSFVTLQDFISCSLLIMSSWTPSICDTLKSETSDLELEKEFLQDLRDLKGLGEKEKEIKR